jgi:hypothetical protein
METPFTIQANNITTGSVSGIAVTGGAINNIYRIKFMLFHLQVLESLGQ